METTEPQLDIKVLVIDKGFAKDGRIKHIQQLFTVEMITVPEPTDEIEKGVEILKNKIETWRPNVIIASSRGGKYAAELVSGNIWRKPLILVGAMSTSSTIVPQVPIVVCHGIFDSTNPIERVREDVELGTPGLIELQEFDSGHDLGVLSSDASVLPSLIHRALKLEQKLATAPQPPCTSPRRRLVQ
jgi:hypothetical protein